MEGKICRKNECKDALMVVTENLKLCVLII